MPSMTPSENIEIFQQNVLRLRRHPFTTQIRKLRMTLKWKTDPNKTTRIVTRPGDHVLAGYVTLIRGFLLNDDTWSLDRLPTIYQKIGASKFHAQKLKTIRRKIHAMLKSQSGLTLNNKPFTHREILDLYTYGNVIHFSRTSELRELQKSWATYDLYMHFVCCVLENVGRAMNLVYSLNEMVLSKCSKRAVPLP